MAVYTPVNETDLRHFLSGYALPDLQSFHGIVQGVENTNYRLEMASGQKLILTLFEKRTDPKDLPFFFAFSQHLAEKGIACPRVIARSDGKLLGQLCERPAVIITFLDGQNVAPSDITLRHCAELGTVLGRMHNAAEDFLDARQNTLSLQGWESLVEHTAPHAHRVAEDLTDTIAKEIEFLKRNWPKDNVLPRGVIHADLFPDNVFFENGQLSGIIDFYFSCTDFYMYDLAIVLNAWCFDGDNQMVDDRWTSLLSAYGAVRTISEAEKESFNVLCRGAALRFLMTRLHDVVFHPADALVQPKDPMEYMMKLVWHQTHDLL